MIDEQKNILIIFTERADRVLSDIIEKYSLQETGEEVFKKYETGRFPKIILLDHLTRDFALRIISEKDMIASLQKDLGATQQTAEQISKEIINNLVPLVERASEDQLGDYGLARQSKTNSGDTILSKAEKKTSTDGAVEKEAIKIPKASEKTEKKLPEKFKETQRKTPDSYREPIE